MSKLINKILTALIIVTLLCTFTNIVYAARTWEQLQQYMDSNCQNDFERLCEKIEWATSGGGSWSNITDADIQAIRNWKSNNDRMVSSAKYQDTSYLENLAKAAGQEAAERANGTGENSNITTSEKAKKRDQLRKEIADFCASKVRTASEAEVRSYIEKVKEYQRLGGLMDEAGMRNYYTLLNNRLQELTGKQDTSVDDENNQHISGGSSSHTGGLTYGSATSASTTPTHTVDEIIKEAEDFINEGKNGSSTINGANLQKGSNTIYNILLSIGIVVAVAVGAYLGLKFVAASAEDKAKVKEALVPYTVGCILIFGAFIIWRLAISLLSGL